MALLEGRRCCWLAQKKQGYERMKKKIIVILSTFILSLFIITLYLLVQSDSNQAHSVEDETSSESNLTTNSHNTSNNSTGKSVSVSIPLKKPPFIKDE